MNSSRLINTSGNKLISHFLQFKLWLMIMIFLWEINYSCFCLILAAEHNLYKTCRLLHKLNPTGRINIWHKLASCVIISRAQHKIIKIELSNWIEFFCHLAFFMITMRVKFYLGDNEILVSFDICYFLILNYYLMKVVYQQV